MGKHIFCCFKIKSATMFIGLIDLFIHMIILVSILSAMQRPSHPNELDLYINEQASDHSVKQFASFDKVAMEDANKKLNGDSPINNIYATNRSRQNKPLGLMVTICSTFITLLLIYGIVKNRPSYIMPYFSIKVFELVITSLTAFSSYSCLASLREWLETHKNFPFRDLVASMNMQQIELLAFAILLLVILIKLYMVIIVWHCYRYMVTVDAFHNLHLLGPSSSTAVANVYALGIGSLDAHANSNLFNKHENEAFLVQPPPKYDEVFATSTAAPQVNSSSSTSITMENGAAEQPTTSSNSNSNENADNVSATLPPAYTLVASETNNNNNNSSNNNKDENIV